MMHIKKPFHLEMFLTTNIFSILKRLKSPVLRCLFHLTYIDNQYSLCATAPTLTFLWFPFF